MSRADYPRMIDTTTTRLSSNQPDMRVVRRVARAQTIALLIVAATGIGIVTAWLVPAFAALLPASWSVMKANTALALVLGCASLYLSRERRTPGQLQVSRVLAGVAFIISLAALVEHLSGWRTGISTLLIPDSAAENPGLMSLQTAAYLSLLGICAGFIRVHKSAAMHVVDLLAMGLVLFSLVVLAGYCFGAVQLFGQSEATRTSAHTLVCMVLLAFVVISRRAEYGFFSVFIGVGIGSYIARLVLPLVFVLPFLLVFGGAYTTLMGWLSSSYASALTAVITSFMLLALLIAMAWRINELERDLRGMSLTDPLTDISNRRGFYLLGAQAMREARNSERPLTVLFIDLDGLKKVNDTLGHDAGSALLVDMADLLRNTFRQVDIVARVGGDEYAVAMRGDKTAAATAMERLDAATDSLNESGMRPYPLSYSVGAATSDGKETFDALVQRADELMYAQKRTRKNARLNG
ncbi:GGDEF domain-containing protein [Salinisphaera aquimarina]|uniref:diguanylate cyclase n=1 Tax=Salinisphaera aquimarina TaxID=2094031 RepID=A0ABV7EMA7_9GAMM